MKDFNFYTGTYKAIAVAICMLLFMVVTKAKSQSITHHHITQNTLTHKS